MLIMCNGIYKSGSTWVFLMLLELVGQGEPPIAWRDPNQARNVDVLKAPGPVLAAARHTDIVAKIHSYEGDYLAWLRGQGARIVVTQRDEVDSLASHYHHFSREKVRLPVWLYAATIGFLKALEMVLYARTAATPDTADLVIDHGELKADPAAVLQHIVTAFGLDYSPAQVAAAAKRADMRGRGYGESFAGMDRRSWFFRREKAALGEGQHAALGASVQRASRLADHRLVSHAITALFLLDPRRGKFRRAGRPRLEGWP